MSFKLPRLLRASLSIPSVGRPIGLVPSTFTRRFHTSQAASMPTVTMRDPKVQLELPNDLASDGGEEVMNFPPFKVRPVFPPPPPTHTLQSTRPPQTPRLTRPELAPNPHPLPLPPVRPLPPLPPRPLRPPLHHRPVPRSLRPQDRLSQAQRLRRQLSRREAPRRRLPPRALRRDARHPSPGRRGPRAG